MIELGTYKLFHKPAEFTEQDQAEGYHAFKARYAAQQRIAKDWLEAQAAAYKEQAVHSIGRSDDAMLKIQGDVNGNNTLVFTATSDFRKFLEDQEKPDIVMAVEAESGAQYVVFAGFVPSPYRTNIGWGSIALNAEDFNRIAYGINPGKAITEAEKQARVEMNDRVFRRVSESLRLFKKRFPNVVIELEEKQLGSFFLRVTDKNNQEYGVNNYELSSIMRRVSDDSDVEAVLCGPELYPTEVNRLREPKPPAAQTPPVREPNSLKL